REVQMATSDRSDARKSSPTSTDAGKTSIQSQRGNPRSSSLSRRDPFSMFSAESPFGSLFQRWNEEMDRFFEDFGLGRTLATHSGQQSAHWSPQVEVRRHGNELIIRADLPGMNKEDVNVELRDNAVVIQGERKEEHEDEREGWYRSERSYGSFYRTIPVPDGT